VAQPWVFEPLVRLGPDGVIVPALASRFALAEHNALRLWLRADAKFSDGAPLTFEDVATSLAQNHLRVAKEDGAVLVSSDDVSLPIDLLISRAFVFRRSGAAYLGTGPFVPVEQDAAHIRLERRNPAGRLVQSVSLLSYPKPQDAFAHTLKGDADVLPDADARWLEFFENVPRFRIEREPGAHANAIAFNLHHLSRTERTDLVAALRNDDLRRLSFGNDCQPPPQRLEFKPPPKGRPLDVLATPIHERFALAVRRELGGRGGSVQILDVQDYFRAIRGGNFDLVAVRPIIWPQITSVVNWRTGAAGNVFGYSNPEVDAALDRRDWTAAQRALDADPPMAVVCTPSYVIVADSRITAASYSLDTLPEWEVAN